VNFSLRILTILVAVAAGSATMQADPAGQPMMTKWGSTVTPDHVLPEYPRPQMVRTDWLNLNGPWNYAITRKEAVSPVTAYAGKILVPFPLQSALSGVVPPPATDGTPPWFHQTENRLWYQRSFVVPDAWKGRRVLLHFGAVGWETTVYLNGKELGTHDGDYDGFSFDITDALKPDAPQELVVSVWDPVTTGRQPHGKQVTKPGYIFYTASTGIWQTVWLEPVSAASIDALKMTPDVDAGVLKLTVTGRGTGAGDTVEAIASDHGREVARVRGRVGSELSLPIAKAELWSPESPFLYDLKVELRHRSQSSDAVTSYFGMRKIAVAKDAKGIPRLYLNGKMIFQLAALDQGFWPDGLYAAPTDDALRFDIETMKKYGFNTDRKHQKVESERWYYWCDKLGLLVWQDMPTGNAEMPDNKIDDNASSPADAAEFQAELKAMIDGRGNHPCITTWTIFNEAGGQHDTPQLTQWLKSYDPTRLVDSASGWVDFNMGDLHDNHGYPGPGAPRLDGYRPSVIGEFGGVPAVVPGHIWQGLPGPNESPSSTTQNLAVVYPQMMGNLWPQIDSAGLCGSVYTQLTDVEDEHNGLMTYDRLPKIDDAIIIRANHGGPFAAASTTSSPNSTGAK
jgi:beta-galactosidase/beta-glucuronidase